ncbi:hypothetical protein MMC21_008443 [Puttea exsequens]|nr:hypothetical protein [Puttea exsequens]
MSKPPASTIDFYRDLILSLVLLVVSRFLPTTKPPRVDLSGKTAIVTGANSGIGFQLALDLANQGATVHLACRNPSKAADAVSRIVSKIPGSKSRIQALSLDTSSFASVREAAAVVTSWNNPIDILIHNAGIGTLIVGQEFTPEGLPTQYATNVLGSFLLTHLLETQLAANARIIFTSSTGNYSGDFSSTFSLKSVKNRLEPGFHVPPSTTEAHAAQMSSPAYNNTKAMQVAFAKLLQRHFDRQAASAGYTARKIAHAFTPGFTFTPIFSKVTAQSLWEDPIFWVLKTATVFATDVSVGAATGVWLATTEDEGVVGVGKGGGYWDRMTRRVARVDVLDGEAVERLWVRWEADAGIEWR